METVAGFAQADIEAARDAAGVGGTVFFPAGTYPVADLVANVQGQTWVLDRSATILRTGGGPLLSLQASGLRLRGGTWDGGRTPSDLSNGFDGFFSPDAEDLTLQNISGWGMCLQGGVLVLRNCLLRNIGYAAILWLAPGWVCQGPVIEGCTIDRSIGFVSQGGIHIRSAEAPGAGWVQAPRIVNTNVILPVCPNVAQIAAGAPFKNAVGIEVWSGLGAIISGCQVAGGKIGTSFGNCRNSKVLGCDVGSAFQYGIEVAGLGAGAGSLWCVVEGNSVNSVSGQGTGASAPSRAVSISGASLNTKVIGNSLYWSTYGVGINSDCTGTVNQFNG